MRLRHLFGLFQQSFIKWRIDKASRLAAALAYYTAFSLAPILVIIIAILGMVLGEQTAQEKIIEQFRDLVGNDGAILVQVMMRGSQRSISNLTITTISSIIFFIFGATSMFVQLQDALNTIWEVQPKPGRRFFMVLVRDRIVSFALVFSIGLVLLAALFLSAGLAWVNEFLQHSSEGLIQLGYYLDLFMSFGVITVLFAFIYKVLPDVQIKWKDVWVGAIMTSILFAIGKSLIGIYLGHGSFSSTYGAAGSLVALLLWIYYSTQIILFGAEFTRAYAQKYGSKILPASYAISVSQSRSF